VNRLTGSLRPLTSRARRTLLTCGVVGACLFVMACSNGSKASASSSRTRSSSTSTASTASTGPIKIGTIVPLTGPGFQFAAWLAGSEAAVRSINAHGGVDGRKLDLVSCDDQNNPNQAAVCARNLVSDKVVAEVGGVSIFDADVTPILNDAHIAMLGWYPIAPATWSSPNYFPTYGASALNVAASIYSLKAAGVKTFYVNTTSVTSASGTLADAKLFGTEFGVKLVGNQNIPSTASDMTPYVEQFLQSKAGGLFYPGVPQSTVSFLSTANQVAGKFVFGQQEGGMTPAQIASIGLSSSSGIKIYQADGLPPISATKQYPALKQFTTDMNAERRAGNANAAVNQRNTPVLNSWLSVEMFAQIVKDIPARKLSAATVISAIKATKNLSTGILPPWTPNTKGNGPVGFARMPKSAEELWVSKVQPNGTEVLVKGPVKISFRG
jgi:ABC-type branched-subunit amino acid transport system substrate-binding protein